MLQKQDFFHQIIIDARWLSSAKYKQSSCRTTNVLFLIIVDGLMIKSLKNSLTIIIINQFTKVVNKLKLKKGMAVWVEFKSEKYLPISQKDNSYYWLCRLMIQGSLEMKSNFCNLLKLKLNKERMDQTSNHPWSCH